MDKNKFFEKVGKLTFSVVLTWVLVTGLVFAWTTWNTYTDWDTLSWTQWWKMVTVINSKISLSDLTWYYTQAEVDTIVWWITSDPLILPSIKQKSIYMWIGQTSKTLTCWSWEQVISCGFTKIFNKDEDTVYCNLNLSTNWCNFYKDESGWNDGSNGFCYCSYYKNGTWDSWSSVSYSWSCNTAKLSTTKSTWSCQPWSLSYYYSWESACTYTVSGWSRWESEPIEFDWYKYSTKKKQTCN